MTETRKMIELLQSTVPSDTVVTVSAEVNLLESLGVVSGEKAIAAMRTGSLFVPPDTPATFRGLMNLLTQLVRMNPEFKGEHQETLNKASAEASQIDDFQLTFGTMLPICQKLLEAKKR